MEQMKRLGFLSVVLAGAFVMAVFATVAAAAPPVKSEITFSDTGILEDVCAFPIAVDAIGSGTEIDFFDNSGALTRVEVHVTEQTTFTANGTSLTTVPFTYDISVRFDDSGNISDVFVNGIIARVPLPDGGLFISAGRVDIAARGFPQFVLTPDAGGTVNLDRFCAALAP
jgi:hypothetical protein